VMRSAKDPGHYSGYILMTKEKARLRLAN